MEAVPPVGSAKRGSVRPNQLAMTTLVFPAFRSKDRVMVNDAANHATGVDPIATIEANAKRLGTDDTLEEVHIVGDCCFGRLIGGRATRWDMIVPTGPSPTTAREQASVRVQNRQVLFIGKAAEHFALSR